MATTIEFVGNGYPSYKNSEELVEWWLSRGHYEWAYNSSCERRDGMELPGIDDLVYKIVRLEPEDYVLSIDVLEDDITVKIHQIIGDNNQTECIFEMKSAIGTIGDSLLTSLPLFDFKDNLTTAMNLYLTYHKKGGDLKEIPESIDLTSIEEKLKKLSEKK